PSNTPIHRPSISTRNTPTDTVSTSSPRPAGMNSNRPASPPATAQTSSAAQDTATTVPTQFARTDDRTSPRTSRAKLVVIPHAGHGLPVSTTKLHGGIPN